MHGTYEEKLAMRERAKYLLCWALSLNFLPWIASSLYVALLRPTSPDADALGVFIMALDIACWFASIVFWCFGLAKYAESKGCSRSYGFFGILGLLGLLVVAIKKDEFKIYVPAPPQMSNYQRPSYDWNNKDVLYQPGEKAG